jgi:hypothetical protein
VIQTEVLPGPKFVSDTLSRDYGLVAVGESSAAQAITVTNSGGSNLMLGTVTLTGTDSADFHLYSDGCSNTTLPPNGSCTVSAQFAPTQAGLKSASINFPDNAEGPHQIGLSGTGGAEGLLNGGFNDYSAVRPHIPTSWQSLGFSATDGKNIRIKAEGIASVRISNISPVKKTLTQVLAITGAPGDVLQLSAWARGRGIPSSNGVARIIVRLYNGPTPIQTQILNFAKGTYPFKQTTANFTAAGAYDRILVRLIYTKGGGIIWVDSVSLLKSP